MTMGLTHAVWSADDFHVCPSVGSVATNLNVETISFSSTKEKVKAKDRQKVSFFAHYVTFEFNIESFSGAVFKFYILVLSSVLLSLQHQ